MIEMPLELGLLLGSAGLYAVATRPTDNSRLLLILVVALLALQAFNWFGPPPNAIDVGLWGLALFAFLVVTLLASWVARSRVAR